MAGLLSFSDSAARNRWGTLVATLREKVLCSMSARHDSDRTRNRDCVECLASTEITRVPKSEIPPGVASVIALELANAVDLCDSLA